MPRLAWLTDLHLNFAGEAARRKLCAEVREANPDRLLIGGDIAEAGTFVEELHWIAKECDCPVSFVLGNHDYYKGSIAAVRQLAEDLTGSSGRITWLPVAGVVRLAEETALIGHGGWGDARAGNWEMSDVLLNDYLLIDELRSMELTVAVKLRTVPDIRAVLSDSLRQKLHALGDAAAAHLQHTAREALSTFRHIIVLMHVPPFLKACWHEGRLSDENWSPHFVCAAAGDALRQVMSAHPDQTMTVLCGHTHSGGEAQILPNLTVLTGDAHYGHPAMQRVMELPESPSRST